MPPGYSGAPDRAGQHPQVRRTPALKRLENPVTLGKRNGTTEIIVEPGDTSGRNYGFAFDIRTTTICGQLIDLNSKKILGTKAAYNKQSAFGSDAITRIIFAQEIRRLRETSSRGN